MQNATVADTLCDLTVEEPIQAQPIDPPTLAMTVSVNDSPLAGREGDKVQSRVIRDRLLREAEGNVAIKVHETGEGAFEVAGRGELQLGVLIETMRREGFELSISRPRVLFQTGAKGERLEPIEEVTVDVDDPYTGVVIEKISQRKGEMQDMRPTGAGKTRIIFIAPSRGLIGYHGEFLTDTRGTGVMNRMFHGYAPHKGTIEGRINGVLISTGDGEAVAYALWYLEERGKLFIVPGTKVYQGMIIGQNAKDNDLDVNPLARQAAHQHPHHVEGRSGAPDADRADDAGTGDRLYRGRRAGRSDAAVDPHPQARALAARPQAQRARRGGLVTLLSRPTTAGHDRLRRAATRLSLPLQSQLPRDHVVDHALGQGEHQEILERIRRHRVARLRFGGGQRGVHDLAEFLRRKPFAPEREHVRLSRRSSGFT